MEFPPPKRTWRHFVSSSHARLADVLPGYRAHVRHLMTAVLPRELGRDPTAAEVSWGHEALRLIGHAEEALQAGRCELGWKCYNEAQRMEIRGLGILAEERVREPLHTRAIAIAFEAEAKLPPWRKKAVQALIGPADAVDEKVPAFKVAEAHALLVESFANNYHLMRVRKWQVALLAAIAVAALASWWGLVGAPFLSARISNGSFPPGLLHSLVAFGMIGAAVSGMITLVRAPAKSIPDQLRAWTGTIARVIIGAVAALIIFLALESTVLDGADSRLILLQAFVAGFSERLLSAAVEKAGG